MHDSRPVLDVPAPPALTAPLAFDPSAPVPEAYDLFCEGCGYSLIGLAADRCPECGLHYDALALPYARVPWLHRRRIGRWSAYWQTVRQVVFHPRAFATELCRPVRISADDARRFRGISIHLAALSAVFFGALLVSFAGAFRPPGVGGVELIFLEIGLCLLGWASGVTFLRLASDMPVFIWEGLPTLPPSELAPLHHYASAPLALVPLVAAAGSVLAVVIAGPFDPFGLRMPVQIVWAGILLAWVLACWRTPVALMRAATGCGWGRALVLTLYLPVHWFLMALLTMILTGMVIAGAGEILKHLF
jgi:hypothetical protein